MFARPVIHRRRFLLATLAAGLGAALAPAGRADPARRPAKPAEGGDDIGALVAQVSRSRLERHVSALAAFPTRWTPGPGFPAVETFVAETFVAETLVVDGARRAAPRWQAYRHSAGMTRHNILMGDPVDPRGVLLVGAHMDSLSETPQTRAPGANDNASGLAALFEAHRILSGVPLGKGLVFAAFSGEEQGLQGSNACAAAARAEGWPIEMMLNLDMLAAHPVTPGAPIYVEYDQGNAVAANDAPAAALARTAARMARAHTRLTIAHTDIWDSDYMGFEAQGYPCIGFYDGGADQPSYHSTRDVPEAMDFDRLEQVTRLVVATLAAVGGTAR